MPRKKPPPPPPPTPEQIARFESRKAAREAGSKAATEMFRCYNSGGTPIDADELPPEPAL